MSNQIHKITLEAASHKAKHLVFNYNSPAEATMDDLLQYADLVGRIEALDASGRYSDLVGDLRTMINDMRNQYSSF